MTHSGITLGRNIQQWFYLPTHTERMSSSNMVDTSLGDSSPTLTPCSTLNMTLPVRARLRPGTYHILVLMELRQICRMGAQGDRSLLNALSRKCYMCMLQYVHRGALP